MTSDAFKAKSTLEAAGGTFTYYRLGALSEAGIGHVAKLPTRSGSCWRPACATATASR